MEVPNDFLKMVEEDIQSITMSFQLSFPAKLSLHRQLDGRYQACIKDWYKGLRTSDKEATQLIYGSLANNESYVEENLEMMKAKLETFRFQMNLVESTSQTGTQVNVTTNVNISITFEQVRAKIEDMTSLTDEQTKEVLEKVSEIESAVKGDGSKKLKWEKIKPVLTWLADKSFDVGMTLLPLLLKIQ